VGIRLKFQHKRFVMRSMENAIVSPTDCFTPRIHGLNSAFFESLTITRLAFLWRITSVLRCSTRPLVNNLMPPVIRHFLPTLPGYQRRGCGN
jgi:hypothetical protein